PRFDTLSSSRTMHLTLSSSLSFTFFVYRSAAPRYLHSFPTRRSSDLDPPFDGRHRAQGCTGLLDGRCGSGGRLLADRPRHRHPRSEEHTSELQSLTNLVCRLLLEKKNSRRARPALTQTGTRHQPSRTS